MIIDFHNNEMSIFIYVCGSDPDSSYCTWSHKRPERQNYTELTFVRIDEDEPMEKVDYDRYLVHDAVACDKQGMMKKLTDTPAYIAYLTKHVYDDKTDSYYHSDPVIVDAKNISSENDNDTQYLFECFFYVNKKGCVAMQKALHFCKASVLIIHLRLNISTARVRAECKRILPVHAPRPQQSS